MLHVKTILHATDFSPQAENAFHLALALARDYGAHVVVTHVREPVAAVYGEFGAFPVDPGEDRANLQEKLAQIKRNNKLEVSEALLAEGDPATEIVSLAKDERCDLIVMGTHGRTGLGRLLMGSVAEQVVRKAHCPVLTIKNPAGRVAETTAVKDGVAVG
jgi:nucleotide-binding universal stress UspA family protein